MSRLTIKPTLLTLCATLWVAVAPTNLFATAKYVYHERTGNNPGCGAGNYVDNLIPTAAQSVTVRFKVEDQFFTDRVRVYYTTDGSAPSGAFGVGSGTTTVLVGAYDCTFGGPVVDVASATIPLQSGGTTVKYVISAWHSGGGVEIFANSGEFISPFTTSAQATLFQYTVAAPEIAVEQPAGTGLIDGAASISFGNVNVGASGAATTFTITNSGNDNLTSLAITTGGSHPGDFAVGALGATTLAPGASTTFTVTFTPGCGARSATLQIASNDTDENPFDINLTGTGVDVTPPVINCGQNETVSCMQGWGFTVPIVNDNCDGLISGNAMPLTTVTNFTCGYTFVATRVWTVSDMAGNTTLCTQVVTYVDTIAPSITTCPVDVTVQCLANVPVPDISSVTAAHTFDPCDSSTISIVHISDATNGLCPTVITRTYRAYDACSNASSACTQTITVNDTTPPVINCGMDQTVQCGTAWNFTVATITDNCDASPALSIVSTTTNATCGNTYVATRVWTGMDACGNTTNCTQVVTIVDVTAPSVSCPANITVKTANVAGEVVTFSASATDACDPSPLFACVPPSGGTFPIGITAVTCTGSDACNNTNTCSFTVTMLLGASTNYVVGASIPDNNITGLASTKQFSSSIGIVTDVNVTFKTTGGYNGDLYAYVTHDSGFSVLLNRAGRTLVDPLGYGDAGFNVTFDDQSTNGDVHVYRFTLNGSHAVALGGALTNAWAPDGRASDPLAVLDTPDARTELLSDFNGLNPNGSWTLFVADLSLVDTATLDQWGLEVCGFLPVPASVTTQPLAQALECSSNVTFTATAAGTEPRTNQWYHNGVAIPGASGLSLTINDAHPSDNGNYTFVVCNMANCATSSPASLTVMDTIAPSITCPANITGVTDGGQCSKSNVMFAAIASDGCSSVSIACTPASGSTFLAGATIVTCTATDLAGNTNACTFTVTISDTELPSIACPANIVASTDGGLCSKSNVTWSISASDNCPGVISGCVPASDSTFAKGVTTVTCSAFDTSGNSNGCTFTVTIDDTEVPTIACPANIATNQVNGCVAAVDFALVVTDNCPGSVSNCVPASGTVFALGLTLVECSATDASGNTNLCSFTVTVTAAAPAITSQPVSQATPMGNGAVFSVVATGTATLGYQWTSNGVPIAGATGASVAISNLTLSASGAQIRVVVSNCAGSQTSVAAVLTVTPITGISFDFNTPGQFTNTHYGLALNNFMNSALPPLMFERSTGGVGVATGGGSVDLVAAAGDNGTTLLPVSYDFSLPGKTLVASAMIKLKVPTVNSRALQLAFVSATNFNNAWQHVQANNGQGFMSVILQSVTNSMPTTVNYHLRAQHKVTAGTTAIETFPLNSPTNSLATNNWYKLVTRFVNAKAAGNSSSNFTVEATLQNMGADGQTPGAVVLGMTSLLQTNVDLVNASRLFLCIRSAAETAGVDYLDNIYVQTQTGAPVMVQNPQGQVVLPGRQARFQALVDGDGPYAYQWQKNGGSGFTNIPNAQSWNLLTDPLLLSDGGAQYRVVVTGASGSVTSGAGTVTVFPSPLAVVSVGSVEGSSVGVRFNQPVSPASAEMPGNYSITTTGGVVAVVAARLHVSPTDLRNVVQDGTRVVVTPAVAFTGPFTVTVSGVQDLSGGLIGLGNTASGTVAGLTGEDINPYFTAPSGQQFSFADGQFEVSGGGADIWDRADSFRYVYKQVTGDFDVKARIPHVDVMRGPTKAGFDVRTSLDPFSPQVLAAVNPQLPGRNATEGTFEATYNVLAGSWGTASALSYPNVWLRMRRVGNTFLRYSGTNGVNWQLDGQLAINPAMPETVYMGLAMCSVANGNLATAWFENFGNFTGHAGATDIGITQQPINVSTGAPNAALLTVVATLTNGPAVELAYTWQRENGMGGWTNMPTGGTITVVSASTNVLNTGALFENDSGAQYRVIVSAPGAQSVTSFVAVVTVNNTVAPTIVGGYVPTNAPRNIILAYSEPMGASALSIANYAVTNGPGASFGVASAVFLNGDPRVVQLTTTSDLAPGSYGVLVNGVQDMGGNAIAANTVRLVFQMGFGSGGPPIVVELYTGLLAGGAITDLVTSLKFAGGDVRHSYPELINYSNVFGINPLPAVFPNTLDNYGIRMYTWFVPTNTGFYKFYTRADDFALFLMNTNANPVQSLLPPDAIIASSNASPPVAFNSPVAQQAYHALDNNINTKYLNFHRGNPGLVVSPAVGSSVVTGMRFTTAEDSIERDPVTFTLEGTTGSPATGPWALIASANTGLLTNRLTTGPVVSFPNTTAYTSYRLLFPALRNTGNSGVAVTPNSMQIAEIEFLDAGGVDVTGRGAIPQVSLAGNFQSYTNLPGNHVTNFLNAGQRYFMELRFKESTGGDGGTVAIRTGADTGIPALGEVIPGTLCQYPAPHAPSTPVQIELYSGLVTVNPIGNGRIEDLEQAAALPQVVAGLPNVTGFGRHFGMSTNLANFGLDNYFGRLYAYFIPPSNGLYKFYMRSDDSSQLWMNTNAVNSRDPAGMKLMSSVERFINANYWLGAENVQLTGGQRYYMEGRWREGGGGDGMVVTYRSQGDATTPFAGETIPSSQLEMATNQFRYGPVTVAGITPLNPIVNIGETITFQAVGIGGTPPYGIFWLKNGVQIFANNPIYTNQPVTSADNGAVFTLVVTNPWSRVEVSSTISVPVDNTPPALTLAVGSQYQEYVTVLFDGPVDAASAACLANYTINNGVSVLSVAYDSGRGNRVSLRTTAQTPGTAYTVTVNNVKDRAGNTIAANSTLNYTAWTWGGCGFLVEMFTNIAGGTVDNLVKDSKYVNNLSDVSYYTNQSGVGRFGAESGLNNYGARLSAYVIPPSNGLYRFYIRGDDGTQLFMNTNGPDARLRTLIARNDNANSASNLTTVPQLSGYETGVGLGILGASVSPVISLTNGTAYYIEGLLKEGGGGDHMEIVFRAVNPGTLANVPALPLNPTVGDLSPLFAGFFAAPGNPDAVQLVNIQQSPPADLFVMEGDSVSLALVATITPPSAVLATCYQWQRETAVGSGVFTNIPGALDPALPVFAARLSEDSLRYRLQAMLPVPRIFTTTLHVMADGSFPVIVGASSLGGTNIDICYSEFVSLNPAFDNANPGNSAGDNFNYTVNGGLVGVDAAILRPDGRSVTLRLASPLGPPGTAFSVQADNIANTAVSTFGSSSTNGRVQSYIPLDIGAPPGAGSSFSCREGEIDVIAGGADIWGASDQGHMTLRPICGDFDIWARVQRLDRAVADNDGITKAGLMVRESLAPDGRKLHVLVEPPATVGGRELYEAGQRPAVGANTAAWNGGNGNVLTLGRAGIPNAWIRIKRTGNSFMAFRSLDGVAWTLATTNNVNYSNVVYVGMAATAHIPSPSAATTYAEFRDIHIPDAPVITIAPSPADQTVAVYSPVTWSVTAVNPPNSGPLTYQWQRNGNNIPGATGSTYSITIAATADTGLYTVVVGNDGGCTNVSVTLNVLNLPPLVVGEMLMATQNMAQTHAAADLLVNDSDPEGTNLTLLGVSGYQPLNLNFNFEDGLVPAGTALFGTPLGNPGAQVGDDGTGTNKCVHLTDAGNLSAFGAYVIPDMAGGRTVNALQLRWKNRIGGALNNALQFNRPGADGMSLSWGADVPAAPGNTTFEDGVTASGLVVAFDTWDSGGFEAPSIEIRWNGALVVRDTINADQGLAKDFLRKDRFVDVSLTVTPEGRATVVYDGMTLDAMLPGFTGIANGRLLFGARTGGAFDNHWIDDISLLALTRDTTRDVLPVALGGAVSGGGGGGYITSVGGVGNSGVLHLTDSANGQHGALVLDELLPGRATRNFAASFVLQLGSGSADGADGMSFNLASDLVTPAPNAGYEDGAGTGLSICFDNFSGGTLPAGPQIRIKYAGVFIAHQQIPKWNSAAFVPVTINLDPDGTVDVMVDGTNVFGTLFPAGVATPYVPIAGARFGLHARTGGLNQRHWIDNLAINTTATDASTAAYFADFNTNPYGTVTLAGGIVTYTPPVGLCGTDTWYYVASDGQQGGYTVGQVDVVIKEAIPTPPAIVTCPTNRTYNLAAAQCDLALPDLTGQLVATDNCCCNLITQNPIPGTVLGIGTHAVEFTVTDTMGLTATCTNLVTVSDVTPPEITCSTNIIAECTGPTGAVVSYTVSAADCDPAPLLACLPASGSLFPIGLSVVTCNSSDMWGNATNCMFTVDVVDRTPPVITDCGLGHTYDSGLACTFAVPDLRGQVAAADLCGMIVIVQTPAPGTLLGIGTHTVTFTVTDPATNFVSCNISVIVRESIAPSILCPSSVLVKTINPTGSIANFTVTTTDNCDTNPVLTCVPASGDFLPMGATAVSCVSVDQNGNSNSCSFVVTVNLGDAATFVVNAPIPDNDANGLASTRTVATQIGILTDVNVRLNLSGGYNGDLYAYLVHESGYSVLLNRVGRSAVTPLGYGDTGFDVTLDDQATSGDVHGYRTNLFGNHTMALAGALTNSWAPDGRSTDPASVLDTDSRTELLNSFNGLNPNGEWTLFIADLGPLDTATLVSWGLDLCGLPPIPPSIMVQPQGLTVQCSSNAVFTVATTGTPPLTNQWYHDGVLISGANGLTLTVPGASLGSAGSYTVTVRGMGGSVTSAPASLTVVDTIAPVLTCPANITAECATPAGTVVSFSVNVLEGCTVGLAATCVPASGSVFPPGITTVNCSATDASANNGICAFTVRVVDTSAPTLCNSVTVTNLAGTVDDFTGPETASPSSNLLYRLTSVDLQGFDADVTDAWLAHTFSNISPFASEAKLRIRMRAVGGVSGNDAITLGFVGTGGALMPPQWTRPIGQVTGDAGLHGAAWAPGTTNEFVLNLRALPNANGSTTDLLSTMQLRGSLDIMVQDDTAVDYISLEVVSCQCVADIVRLIDPGFCGAVVSFPVPAFSDLCDASPTVVCNPPSGSFFGMGSTLVRCTASDASGNTNYCSFRVTVNDPTPALTIARVGNNIVICWPATCVPLFLEQTPSLNTPIIWSPVPDAPVLSGSQYCVTLPIQPGNRFFRLRQ